ncbi:MAG: flagellar M-ring protein FliF [Treponema sp.]|nr:flagellar M-ring protein FliF [Treponema sp.]
MNEWLKKVTEKFKETWAKWKPIQKVILFATVAVVIVVIIATARVSSKPSQVRVFSAPVTDSTNLSRMLDRINAEGIDATTSDGYIYVADQATKTKVSAMLNADGLIPSNIDIWANYFDRSWSTTDEDQNQKLLLNKKRELENFIRAYDGIRDVSVILTIPEPTIFAEDQTPVKCSVILTPQSNSFILKDTKKIHSIHNAILACVEGLNTENLVITDDSGNCINDFESMADSDAVDVTAKQQRLIVKLESEYKAKITKALKAPYPDRVNELGVTIKMDQSKRSSESTEYSPIVRKEDNPDTPYDDSDIVDYITVSSQTVTREYETTGYTPEGPAGIEGQNPPVYSDVSNVLGHSTETGTTENHLVNTKQTSEVVAPKIDAVSVGVDVDGTWILKKVDGKYVLDDEGWRVREYTPVPPEKLAATEQMIKGIIGYDRNRGDLVSVTNIGIDHTKEFHDEDTEYFARQKRTTTIILVLVSIVIVLVGFILFRIISKELERRRREREARLLAEQQAARERALWDAKEDGMEVTMSVEETRRMELQENAISMAKEHPEDVAMLIRTWLMEE